MTICNFMRIFMPNFNPILFYRTIIKLYLEINDDILSSSGKDIALFSVLIKPRDVLVLEGVLPSLLQPLFFQENLKKSYMFSNIKFDFNNTTRIKSIQPTLRSLVISPCRFWNCFICRTCTDVFRERI